MAWHAETAVVTQWCFFFSLCGVTQSAPFPACASDSSPSCPLPIHMCCSISYLCADGLSMALTSHTMLAMDARAAVALLRDWRSEHTAPCPAVQRCTRHAVSIVVRAGATLLPPPTTPSARHPASSIRPTVVSALDLSFHPTLTPLPQCRDIWTAGGAVAKRLNSSRRVSNLDKNRSRTDLGVVMFKWLQLHNARGPTIVHTLDR